VAHADHDLTDSRAFIDAIRGSRPDLVLHLAWSASGSPQYRTSSDNSRWVVSSFDAAQFCLEDGITFLATGTVADEGAAPDAYTRAKQALRRMLEPAIEGRAIGWIRPFYVFDPEARRPALVADASAALASGRPVELRSPHARHDFIHASDVGTAIVSVIEHDLRGVVDVGSGRSRSVVDLVHALGAGWCAAENTDSQDGDVVADNDRLLRVGWRPVATESFFSARSHPDPPE
jgi:nucleoside-diphosphate-sugar epimerase